MSLAYSPERSSGRDVEPASRAPRRLPTIPGRPRASSRPLPPIPRPILACKLCRAFITYTDEVAPTHSTQFKGFSGKASLVSEVHNVTFWPPSVQLMATGAHTMQTISCVGCDARIGWKIVRASHRSERWKEGHFLLELESLSTGTDQNQFRLSTESNSR